MVGGFTLNLNTVGSNLVKAKSQIDNQKTKTPLASPSKKMCSIKHISFESNMYATTLTDLQPTVIGK